MTNFNERFRAKLQTTKQTLLKDVTYWLNSQSNFLDPVKKSLIAALKQTDPDQVLAQISAFPITRQDMTDDVEDAEHFKSNYVCTTTHSGQWNKVCDILNIYDRLLMLERLLVEPKACEINVDTLNVVITDALSSAKILNLPGHRADCKEQFSGRYEYLSGLFEDVKGYNAKIILDRQDDTSISGSDIEYILNVLINQPLKDWYRRDPAGDFKYRFWFSPWQNIWENLSKNLFDSSLYYGKDEERNRYITQVGKEYTAYQQSPVQQAIRTNDELINKALDSFQIFNKALEAKGMRMDTDKQIMVRRSPMDPLQFFTAAKMFTLFSHPSALASHPLLRLVQSQSRATPPTARTYEHEPEDYSPQQNY